MEPPQKSEGMKIGPSTSPRQQTRRRQVYSASLPISLATSSALVSENVIDASMELQMPMYRQTLPSDARSSASENDAGVNRHSYTPESISQMMANANTDYYDSSDLFDESSETGGILESTKKWLHTQNVKRRKQALEKAVEEQRRVLLEETLRAHALNAMAGRQEDFERGLNENTTFQSLTRRKKYPPVGAALCGGTYDDELDDDEEYIDDDDDGIFHDHGEEYYDALQSLPTSSTLRMQDEDLFRIGQPSGTDTGGMAVHLEFLHNSKPEKKDLVKIYEEKSTTPCILSAEQMTEIAENGLPASVMYTKWKRLYSLQRDGDSFGSCFLPKVKGHVRTFLVVQTTNHEIMGAYSNSTWETQGGSAGAQFYGSAEACLFSIQKDTKQVLTYKWTGKNRYIQVCDLQHKMIALGGGGKDSTFGLCVEDDFRVGSTGPCETFDNAPLCEQETFEIMNVECWGFVTGFC